MLPELKRLFTERTGFDFDRHVILLGYVGSIAHGTHTPSEDPASIDDVDTMGVVIPPADLVMGGARIWEHCVIQEGVIDSVFYSLSKFVALLLKANPNVLGTLWLAPEHLLVNSTPGMTLRGMAARFSTLRAYDSFVGYAYGQLHRMEAFDVSRMEEYEHLTARLGESGIVVRELLEADPHKLAWFKREKGDVFPANDMDRFRSLHKQYFSGYMGAKRKGLVKRIGYDAKNAAHLIRLMRMCVSFLEDGILRVDRTGIDADELRAIKAGEWTLEQVKAESSVLFALAKERRATSTLPVAPDGDAIGRIVADLHLGFYGGYLANDLGRRLGASDGERR